MSLPPGRAAPPPDPSAPLPLPHGWPATEALLALSRAAPGGLLLPTDAGFPVSGPAPGPHVAVRPRSVGEVTAVAEVAARHGLRLTAELVVPVPHDEPLRHATGNATGGAALATLLTDRLVGVRVDEASGTALVEAGAAWPALHRALTATGRRWPAGRTAARSDPRVVPPLLRAHLAAPGAPTRLQAVRTVQAGGVVRDLPPAGLATAAPGVVVAATLRIDP